MIKIGLSSLFILGKPFKTLLEVIPKYDVNYWEIVDDGLQALNRKRAKALLDIKSSYDFEYSVHAPVADVNIASMDSIIRRAVLKRLEKSIFYSGIIESRVWVLHSGWKTGLSYFFPGKDWKINVQSLRRLAKMGEDVGVRVAVENYFDPLPHILKNVKDFERLFGEVSDVFLAFDVGHANIMGQIHDFPTYFSDRILVVHLHDNNGVEDTHLAMGQGCVDWDSLFKLLTRVGYDNNLTIEVESAEAVGGSFNFLRGICSKHGVQVPLGPLPPQSWGKSS